MRGWGKRRFTLINRGVSQTFYPIETGGRSEKFLNLNTMSRVMISIITNRLD
jgi:hypothetical protein